MKLKAITAVLGIVLIGAELKSQDEPPRIETAGIQRQAVIIANANQEGGEAPVELHSIQLSADLASGDGNVYAFSTLGPGAMSFSTNGANGSGLMNLLQNKSIRDEIELVDDQYKKMTQFYQQRQKEIMSEINSLIAPPLSGDKKKSNRSVQFRGTKLKELIKKQKEESESQLRELLLPHQLKRLEQVSHQVRMRNSGTLNALTRGKLKEELDLTDEDVKKLQTKSEEIQKDLEAEIAKLRAKAKKNLLKELSPTQRKKLDELMGEQFDYQPTDWKSQIKKMERRVSPKAKAKK